jgi:galactonate dehydratase
LKIESVESFVLEDTHYLRVCCDDGTTGLGQSGAWGYPEAVNAVVQVFREYLVGQDPMRIEHHWQHLYRMLPFRGSILSGALSAVDIALWDAKGKRLGVPVWELLGGRVRDRIRLYLIIDGDSPDELAHNARVAAEEGYTAIKLEPLPPGYQDMTLPRLTEIAVEYVAAAREAVGLDVDIVLEMHRKLTPLQFPTLAHAFEPFRPLFVEDPIQIDSIALQGDLARRVRVPIGNGERLHTIWEFRELLEAGGSQFVRPDLGLAGGISQCRKIAVLAESYHAAVCSHNFTGPVLTAAAVHLDATIPNFVVQEYSEIDEGPFGDAFTGVCRREGGYLQVPEAPGLGVELDESRAISMWGPDWARTPAPLRTDGSVAMSG